MKKIFLIIINFYLFITFLSPADAADLCCEIKYNSQNSGKIEYTLVKTEQECKDKIDQRRDAYITNNSKCAAPKTDLGSSLPKLSNPLDNPNLSVKIPSLASFRNITCKDTSTTNDNIGQECYVPWLADYIDGLYKYGIGALAILAVVTMMIGGVVWLTAAGNEQKISDAKTWINGSLMGVLIALTSYLVLNTLNPALIQLSPIKITSIEKMDLGEFEINGSTDGKRDTTDCPNGPKTIKELADYFTKTKTLKYSQSKKGECEGETCYCDCSWFSDHLGRCANLTTVNGEGTSAGLITNSKKVKITQNDCNNSPLKAGDIIVWNDGSKGHVMTFIGDNKIIECGGGSFGNSLITKSGAVKISDWKLRCSNYMLKRGAYYIKR